MNTKPSSPSRTYYDVVVAGGGPAGAAMATFLARAGHSCLVFDQSKFPRYHIGESLIPHTFGVLDRLGLLPKLRASDFPLTHSVRFVAWNGDESAPFYFSERIPGERAVTWQVERAVVDRLLKEEIFLREVAKCAPLADRLARSERIGPVRGLRQLPYLNRETCGDGCVMIGDACAFRGPIYSSGLFRALASAELAAQCIHEGLERNDVSAARLGRFESDLWAGVEVIRRLISAFYDPQFSFPECARCFPEQRAALIDLSPTRLVRAAEERQHRDQ